MERVPTQTDLVRVCDAVDDLERYCCKQMANKEGRPSQFHEAIENTIRLIECIPRPRYFVFSFDARGQPMGDLTEPWRGWGDETYSVFLQVIQDFREVVFRWREIYIDNDFDLHPMQRIGISDDSMQRVTEVKNASDRLRQLSSFVPCEEQQDILKALDGRSMTADELEKTCAISRSRLYGKRNDKNVGGLNELMLLDLVRNGRTDGSGIRAYYRPDRPPG